MISSDDEDAVTSRSPTTHSSGGPFVVVSEDEQRLLDPDQELNDNVVNMYLQLLTERFHRQMSNGTARRATALLSVSTHFLTRWRSLWREIEEVQKNSDERPDVPCLAQRMRGWIGGRCLPSASHPTAQLCLRHWIALYDIPMRHVHAPKQHAIDTRALLDEHLAAGCPWCPSSACVLFPVHVPKQNHWILTALFIPSLRQWPPSGGRMPLGKVHVYDSMLWLHHRYSRFYPFDDDEEEMTGPQSRAAAMWVGRDDDEEARQMNSACDGRRYRRMLLHRTVRPLLAAVQLIAMHRILNESSPAAAGGSTSAFPRQYRWRVRWHRYSVTQQNAVDCGVAVCKAADHIAQSLTKSALLGLSGEASSHQRRGQAHRMQRRRTTLLQSLDTAADTPGDVYRRRLFRAASDLHMLYWRRIERSNLHEYRNVIHRSLFPQEVVVIQDDEPAKTADEAVPALPVQRRRRRGQAPPTPRRRSQTVVKIAGGSSDDGYESRNNGRRSSRVEKTMEPQPRVTRRRRV